MDINKIEILIRAIELGSLSKAANEFSYTPSAVLYILNAVENEVGVNFIKRTHAGIEVEEGCNEIVDNLKKIVDMQKRTKQIAYDIYREKRKLTIATYASLSKHILTTIIKGFNKKFQDIHINILVVENIRKVYEDGEADILFGEKINVDNICWEKLFTDPYIAIIPKQYNFSGDCIKREELYKQTFIKVKDGKISEYIDESRFYDIINVVSQDDSSAIHMVKEELGVAILPLLSVYDNKSVKCVELDPELHRILGLSYRERDFKIKRELRDFVEYVRLFDFEQFKNDTNC